MRSFLSDMLSTFLPFFFSFFRACFSVLIFWKSVSNVIPSFIFSSPICFLVFYRFVFPCYSEYFFAGLFFNTYGHVVVEHLPCTCRSERDNISKLTEWREPAYRRACTARCVLKTSEEIERCPAYKNIEPITSTHKHSQALTSSWCARRINIASISNLGKTYQVQYTRYSIPGTV